MDIIRAFIAIDIDKHNKQKISGIISYLKTANADIKWITENQIHLTLKFLGNIEQNKIQDISKILKSIAMDFSPFNIQFSGIGAFPNILHPRVIWLGMNKGKESLKLLNNKIETELERLGIRKEKREYKAHLTLGRVRTLKNVSKLITLINEAKFHPQEEIKIDKLILFQSTLTAKGAIHSPLSNVYLSTPVGEV